MKSYQPVQTMTIRVGESRCHRVTAWSHHPSAWYAFLVCSHRGQCVVYMRSQSVSERYECKSVCGMHCLLSHVLFFVHLSRTPWLLKTLRSQKPSTKPSLDRHVSGPGARCSSAQKRCSKDFVTARRKYA